MAPLRLTSARAASLASGSSLSPSTVRSSGPTGKHERVQRRQVVDAFDEIVARRLAELLVGGDDVEDVIDDLECHAVVAPEVGQRR